MDSARKTYLAKAKHAEQQAATAQTTEQRNGWLKIAQSYRALAECKNYP